MQQVTEIDYTQIGNRINFCWGNDDTLFGELEIKLTDFMQWLEQNEDGEITVNNTPKGYNFSNPEANPQSYFDREYQLNGRQHWEIADWEERIRMTRHFLVDHKLILA